MRKFLVLLVFLVGCAVQPASEVSMPTNDDIVDIFRRRMPDLTPQEAQDIMDYFSQIDSAVSHFGGGDTLDIGDVNAVRVNSTYPPMESSSYESSPSTIDAGGEYFSLDVVLSETGNTTNIDKTDDTKLLIPSGSEGQVWLLAGGVGNFVNSRDWIFYADIFLSDDSVWGSVFLSYEVGGKFVSGARTVKIPDGASYIKIKGIPGSSTTICRAYISILQLSWGD